MRSIGWTRRGRALRSGVGSAVLVVVLVGLVPATFQATLSSGATPPDPAAGVKTVDTEPDAAPTTTAVQSTIPAVAAPDVANTTVTTVAATTTTQANAAVATWRHCENTRGCSAHEASEPGTLRVVATGDRASDGAANPLAGVTFEVSNTSNFGSISGTCVTLADGSCDIANLPGGEYYVRETTVPTPFHPLSQLSIDGDASAAYVDGPLVVAGGVTTTRAFANRRANPGLPDVCGIRIAILFDLSNSINSTELGQMKAAATGFVAALQNTPSQVGIFTFGTNAPAYGGATLALQSVESEGTNGAVQTFINGLSGNAGGTNWDAGFRQLQNVTADVVLVLTDGNPTYYVGGGNGRDVTFATVESGVTSANSLKAAHQKVIALGIGSDVSILNLQAISGPVVDDDYFVSDFATLKGQLSSIATRLCGARVNVTKVLDTHAVSDWTFTPTSSIDGVTFNPAAAITGANGTATIDVGAIPAGGTTVSITETQTPETTFVSGSCSLSDGTPVGSVTNGVARLSVQRQQTINCTFYNATIPTLASSVTVQKRTVGGVGSFAFGLTGQSDVNYTVTQENVFEIAATFNQVDTQQPLTLSETSPTGWRPGVFTCADNGSGQAVNQPLILDPGQNVTCWITNTAVGNEPPIPPQVGGTTATAPPPATTPLTPTVAGAQTVNPITGTLPFTGSTTDRILKTGLLLLVGGSGLVLIARIRRKRRIA